MRVTEESNSTRSGWRRSLSTNLSVAPFAAVMMAAVLVASFLVVRTEPRSEFDLRLSDGAVWLSSTALGGVSLLDGGSGTIVASLGVATPGDEFSVEQWGSDAIIVNETDGTVSRLDGSAWNIATGRVQFGEAGQQLDVVAGDDDGWVMTPGQAVSLGFVDLTSSAPIPIAAPFADGAITDGGDLLYASTDPSLPLQRFPADGSDPVPVNGLDGPIALADIGQQIAGIDLDDFQVWTEDGGITCEGLEFPDGAIVHGGGSDSRLIAVSDQGGAFIWNPTAGCPTSEEFINLGPGTYGEPTVTEGWAVVPELSEGEIVVVDIERRTVINRQALEGIEPGSPIDLIAEGGSIWYNDPASANAGLIQRDGTVLAVAKYEDGVDGFAAAPLDDTDADDDADLGVLNPNADQQPEPEEADQEEAASPTTQSPTTTEADTPDDETDEEDQGPEETLPPVTQETIPPEGPAVTSPPTSEQTDTSDTGPTDTTDTTDGDGSTTETTEDTTDTTEETTTTTEPEGVVITMGVSATQILEGEDINFTAVTQHGSPNNWESDVSPAGPTLGPVEEFGSFRYFFPDAGNYLVSITACDQDRNCDTARVQVTVVEDPDRIELIAAFSGPTTAETGESVSFLDASQGDPETWSWDFGPGANPATSSEQNPSVRWATAGTKTVELTITNGGNTDTVTAQVEVSEALICPTVEYEPNISGPTTLDVGESGTFTDTLTPDECSGDVTYSWSAQGGGSISNSTSRTTSISWATAGTYQVTLTWNGGTASDTHTVTVEAPVVAPSAPNIVINGPTAVDEGQNATFTVTNIGGAITTYSWSTEGNSSATDSFTTSWATEGPRTVTLTVEGPGGVDTATHSVSVSPVVTASPFGMTCSVNEAYVDAIFSCDLTTGDPANFSNPNWSVGPGSALSWLMSPWSYDAAGTEVGSTVTVTLTAVDNATGDTVSSTDTVNIVAEPVPALGLVCSPSTQPADGASAATCAISNSGEFSDISYSVSNPSGLALNQWGAPGETYVASFDAGSVTVSATATHIATGTPVSAGGATITFTEVAPTTPPPTPQPMSVGCTVATATTADRFTCSLTSGNASAFSSPSWSIAPGGTLSWGGAGTFSIDVQGQAPGTVTITLTATDIATGQVVSASASVTIN